MLGIVFTEFMEMVETRFSADVLDDVLDDVNSETDGAYTAVGYYDYREMIQMVVALSKRVDVPVDDLVEAFGEHLFGVLSSKYPALIAYHANTLDALESIDGTVHKEVLKLYPQAELPSFKCRRLSDTHLIMQYSSKRPFSILAKGLINGCAKHFEQKLDIKHKSLTDGELHTTEFDIRIAS